MKMLTWNVNKAGRSRRGLWEVVRREDADIVVLQEVTGIPKAILSHTQCHWISPRYFGGHNAPFSSAILSKGFIEATPFLVSESEWANRIQRERYGWIIGCRTTLDSGESCRVVGVHSPAFRIPRDQQTAEEIADLKLEMHEDVWFTEVLCALLSGSGISDRENWIVAGDFNSSVLFDEPSDRGNREIIARLNRLGLTDCLSHHHGRPVPTFKNLRGGRVVHQLDYCYVNTPMRKRLKEARVLTPGDVFDAQPRLSDHLPIVCEFT